ncbi:hypothetical protein [Saccharopolyspora sp. NPDC050642]|uniref:hypothetical protein n=1 Tax=Saccharopolyspora sp. NPDC050642 TaxID=3157099 RepID=UPI0033C08CA8
MVESTTQTSAAVREIEVPPGALALCTLARIDYQNAVIAEFDGVADRTAEQWARATLEDHPAAMREAMTNGFGALGVRLGPIPSDDHVLGWQVRQRTPDHVLLGAGSAIGLLPEIVVQRADGALVFAYFNQQETDEARTRWAAVEHTHVPAMIQLLQHAVDRFHAGR